MEVRNGTDHHGDVLDYLEGEKLFCGSVVSFGIEDEWGETHERNAEKQRNRSKKRKTSKIVIERPFHEQSS